jgi:CheY-like chemotaxis protein
MILKEYLLKKDCEVFLSYTLKEGLQLLRQQPIDILFLDNNLPDGNGWKVVDKLIQEMPLLKIYLVSAYKQKSDFQSASSRVTVWEKPISFGQLDKIFSPADNTQQKESI